MFLPLFIAILLGLATPTNTNHNYAHNGGTVVSANDNNPDDSTPGDDTGGEGAHVPPKKI